MVLIVNNEDCRRDVVNGWRWQEIWQVVVARKKHVDEERNVRCLSRVVEDRRRHVEECLPEKFARRIADELATENTKPLLRTQESPTNIRDPIHIAS
jgi:hypothetical protein